MNISLNGHKKKPDPIAVLDDGEKIARIMRPFYAQLSKLAFDDANAIDGIAITFALDNPYVQKVIDKLAKQVRGVADTTKDDIRRLTGQAADEGWSSEQLAREIRKAGADLSKSRSQTIARTESGHGYNLGAMASYRTAEVTHVDVLDGDDDPICAAANGARWTIEEAEANPLGHPNCTRAFSPVVES